MNNNLPYLLEAKKIIFPLKLCAHARHLRIKNSPTYKIEHMKTKLTEISNLEAILYAILYSGHFFMHPVNTCSHPSKEEMALNIAKGYNIIDPGRNTRDT